MFFPQENSPEVAGLFLCVFSYYLSKTNLINKISNKIIEITRAKKAMPDSILLVLSLRDIQGLRDGASS